MPGDNDHPTESSGAGRAVTGRTKWAVGVGIAVIVIAIAGLGLTSLLADTRVLPIVAIAIAVIGGAAIAVWVIERYPA